MARQQSLAEYYRAHRAAFVLAQELGCTPNEAKAELDRRAARKRWQQTCDRLQMRMNSQIEPEAPARDETWMMRY